ncbi:MAG: hypothetical protein ABIJ56_11890 [Pseudomonadota bacterium]
MKQSRPYDIQISGHPNMICFILRSMIEEHAEKAPLPDKLDIALQMDEQKVVLHSSSGNVKLVPRTLSDAKAVFSGQMDHFLEALVGGAIVRSYLAGKLRFSGNPVEALKSYFWLRRLYHAMK